MSTVETSVPNVIKYTSVVFASLSLLGATYIFLSSIIHKRLRSFSFRMILWMCIFDFILGCSTICGPLGTIEEEAGIANEDGEDIINPKLDIGDEYNQFATCNYKQHRYNFQLSHLYYGHYVLQYIYFEFQLSVIQIEHIHIVHYLYIY